MADRFDQTEDVLTITQSRTELRWVARVGVVLSLAVCILIAILQGVKTLGSALIDLHGLDGLRIGVVLPVTIMGWLGFAAAFARSSVEITAVIDRKAGRIEVRGHGWMHRSWQVSRPLSYVREIALDRIDEPRGRHSWQVHAALVDGTRVLLWSPVAVNDREVTERVAALRGFLDAAPKPPHPWG